MPVYKAEAFLDRCIESVLMQTWQDWELLLVDDGSPDSSGVICDEYVRKDTRIKAFHQSNGGVSSARNRGLDGVTGKWVTFVDADDEIQPMFLESFIRGIGADEFQLAFLSEIFVEYRGILSVHHEGDTAFFNEKRMTEFLNQYVDSPVLKGVHAKFFLMEVIRQNGVRFNHMVRAGEDHLFVLEYLKYIRAAKVIEGNGYVYYKPYHFSLKYSQKIDEIVCKYELMEKELHLLEHCFNIDLTQVIHRMWHRGLSGIGVEQLYDIQTFDKYLSVYKTHINEGEYTTDSECNREALVANMLLQIAGKSEFRRQYDILVSLLCSNIRQADYSVDSFPRSTKWILAVASLRSQWLLKLFLSWVSRLI